MTLTITISEAAATLREITLDDDQVKTMRHDMRGVPGIVEWIADAIAARFSHSAAVANQDAVAALLAGKLNPKDIAASEAGLRTALFAQPDYEDLAAKEPRELQAATEIAR